MKNEIVIYHNNELDEQIEVVIEDETVWLNQNQIAKLFGQTKQNISLHINNCYNEGELEKKSTVKESLTVQNEGRRNVKRKIEFYNLDVIISVGYRVKSKQGTKFRIWASGILKDYLLKGYSINNRLNKLEDKYDILHNKVNEIDLQINSNLIPNQGIFFEGQVFDAYEFTSKLIRSAKFNIILIDNYINETTLIQLSKKQDNVKVLLLTKSINKELLLDVKKVNEQYGNFEIKSFDYSHDRFLIIDNKELYHIGASLKDLGKKLFAFSKLELHFLDSILNKINQ